MSAEIDATRIITERIMFFVFLIVCVETKIARNECLKQPFFGKILIKTGPKSVNLR
jgi:hypothetical protein